MGTQPDRTIPLGYRLPSALAGVKPNRVIYRLIKLVLNEPQAGHLDVRYENYKDPVLPKSIAQVIRETPYDDSESAIPPVKSPLDLNCKEDCYILFHLSRNHNWQFSTDGDCFSTKDPEGSKYSELYHVMGDGSTYGGDRPIPGGCRMLYFRAKCDDSTNHDGFNLKIDLILGSVTNPQTGKEEERKTKLIIDPDIRNPGGSGP